MKEIEKERELNELLNESSKDKPETLKNDLALKKSGLEWMYQDAKLSDEKEDYLLGKKKTRFIYTKPTCNTACKGGHYYFRFWCRNIHKFAEEEVKIA